MIPLAIIRKILLFFVPLILFYFLKKIGKNRNPQKPSRSYIEKHNVVEGEVIEEKK